MVRFSPTGQPRVVLVINDEALRASLTFALETDGFAVESCGDGEALLDLEPSADGACVVLEARLPGMSGLETLVALRERGIAASAVLLAGLVGPGLSEAAAREGAVVVEKPLLGDAIARAVRAAYL
jgi:two-component system C4-dicarboxylate transport response regulator DctD